MKTYRSVPPIPSSEITPEAVYLNRRKFMKAAGLVGAGALLAACAPSAAPSDTDIANTGSTAQPAAVNPAGKQDELGNAANSYQEITNYNNYYEFTTDKGGVNPMSEGFPTSPWEVKVGGLVSNPKTYGIEDLVTKFQPEERIYRLRCVEAWSMVIPWMGFPLSKLLNEVEPTGDAKYVAFTTILDPDHMPGQRLGFYPWPYTEGLRLDEAMHDLAILVTGMYGKDLTPPNGAPLRLAVPWKYGFKSIKAIVQIDLVAEQPGTLWSTIAPDEYGFFANVNPEVDHPRWSQASERRIGELKRRETLMFNGYAEQVASLYEGLDLQTNY